VTVAVAPVNDAPFAHAQSAQTIEDRPVAITLAGADMDSLSLHFSVVQQPAHGQLSGTAPLLTYTPDADYQGPDSFTFTVSDGSATSTAATVTIAVRGALWISHGPKGGTVWGIGADPRTPSILYATTDMGVMRSADSGATWAGASGTGVPRSNTQFAASPTTPTRVYAASAGGLYASADGGGSWSLLANGAFSSIAVHPLSQAIYAGSHDGRPVLLNSVRSRPLPSIQSTRRSSSSAPKTPVSSGVSTAARSGPESSSVTGYRESSSTRPSRRRWSWPLGQ
jgi:hypothetical protein